MISEAELNAFIQTATPETLIVTVRTQWLEFNGAPGIPAIIQ